MDTVLHRFNPWWDSDFNFPGIPRDRYLSDLLELKGTKDVVLITGLRRVGKTTLIHQMIHKLLEEIEAKKIFYVSLDHISLEKYTILDIVEEFRQLSKLNHDDFVYLFLDEVHFKEKYEIQLKNLYDMGNVKIYASGSASLDIIMKSPHLTGRQRIVHILPLDFNEYLVFTGKNISPADQHLYPGLVDEFIETGGMPEYVSTGDVNVLQALVDSILYRDIAARHDIRSSRALRDILSLAAQSVGSPISIRKISRVLGLPFDTVNRILELLVEAGLIHLVEKEGKASERKASPRKMYIADNGLLNVLTEYVNKGARAENLTYLELKKFGNIRYHHSSGREVDFVLDKNAWEVKYKDSINDRDLKNMMSLGNYKKRTVLTRSCEEKLDGIELRLMWKFLLETK